MRFNLHSATSTIEAIGESVELTFGRGEAFAVHATPYLHAEDDDQWRVSHIETGFEVDSGATIDDAIMAAEEKLAQINDEKFYKGIAKAREIIIAKSGA